MTRHNGMVEQELCPHDSKPYGSEPCADPGKFHLSGSRADRPLCSLYRQLQAHKLALPFASCILISGKRERERMFKTLKQSAVALAFASVISTPAFAGDLVINFDDPNPGPKKGFEDAVEKFKAANPDINVIVNITDREAHKTAIRNFLSADAPDVTSWYPGNRMAPFVNAGQFEDVSDLWDSEGFHDSLASTESAMTIDGKQWGVPYTYYQWGIYYRKDVFEENGIDVPGNWEELLAASAKLKEAGIAPFTIGTKFLWTAAGVFDYLNLRTNGYDVHKKNGESSLSLATSSKITPQ